MLKTITSAFRKNEKIIFFFVTIIVGVIFLWPLHNFQYFLAQGDHGRDLYCFKKVLDGQLPYRDFSWLFGPLMPYYYGLCYLIGGISIQSILMGQLILILIAGLLVYLICAVFLAPPLSFICAFWYWSFRGSEFFYTYNHIGGLVALLAALYCVLRYIQSRGLRFVYAGSFSIFCLLLIRLNMGLFLLPGFFGTLVLADVVQRDPSTSRRWRHYLVLILAVLAAASLIYGLLLRGLPGYAIRQSFPFQSGQRTDAMTSVWTVCLFVADILRAYFTATLAQKFFGILLFASLAQSAILLCSQKTPLDERKNLVLVLFSIFVFLVLGSHEFMASGVFYRVYWVFPLIFILIFHLIGISAKNISSAIVHGLIFFTFLLPAARNMQYTNRMIQSYKVPPQLFHMGKNMIYTMQEPRWFETVINGARFLQDHARPDETVLVMPLDPLYLFLSERDSAARQLVFFDHINITEEQERATIREMETRNGNWAVISSRSSSHEGPGMGKFGTTYCLLIAQYLEENFETVATFGDWTNPAGWAWNHGVKILKRK